MTGGGLAWGPEQADSPYTIPNNEVGNLNLITSLCTVSLANFYGALRFYGIAHYKGSQ